MNAKKRTPSDIIGHDKLTQLAFEGFQVVPILEGKNLEPVAYQHRRIDKHGVEGKWEPFKRPLFPTDRHESRALYSEDQILAENQRITDQMTGDLVEFQTKMGVLENVLENLRAISKTSISPITHIEPNPNPCAEHPHEFKITNAEKKDAFGVLKEEDVKNHQIALFEKIASLETQNKILESRLAAQKVEPAKDLQHLTYIESDQGPSARYGFKTTCVSNPGAIAVTPLENAVKREKELLEIIEAFSMAHTDQSGDQNYYLMVMQSAYEAGQKYIKKD